MWEGEGGGEGVGREEGEGVSREEGKMWVGRGERWE